MAKIIIKYSNQPTGIVGTAIKNGIVFSMDDATNQWKLKSKETAVQIEFVWSKKDYPTFEEWKEILIEDGYIVDYKNI